MVLPLQIVCKYKIISQTVHSSQNFQSPSTTTLFFSFPFVNATVRIQGHVYNVQAAKQAVQNGPTQCIALECKSPASQANADAEVETMQGSGGQHSASQAGKLEKRAKSK